jgi:hypothetical protein
MIMKAILLARVAAVLIAAGSGAAWVNRPALPGDQFQLAEGSGSRTRIAEGNGTVTRIAEGNRTQTRIAEGNGSRTRVA